MEKTAPQLSATPAVTPPPQAVMADMPDNPPSRPCQTDPSKTKETFTEVQPSSGDTTPKSYREDNPFDTDIEAMITNDNLRRKSTTLNKSDCPTVWPGRDVWKQKAKTAKRQRHSCNCMARMSRRNRIIVKVLIGLLIVGIAVGVGFGVSKPLGAPIWGDDDN